MADVTVGIEGHVATVTLDRPPVNAVTRSTMAEIRDAFRSFDDRRDVRVAIFTAAGERAFMAGVDLRSVDRKLSDPDRVPPTLVTDPARVARDGMWAISDCAVPVIGAINGPALGAGLALRRLLRHPGRRRNRPPSARRRSTSGSSGRAPTSRCWSVGYKAREMFFTGEPVPAAELHRFGAIRAVVPHAQLMDTARALADELAKPRAPLPSGWPRKA